MSFTSNISRALKHKNYRFYFLVQFFSFIGTWMQGTAQSWLVYRLTESAFFLGAVSFAGAIPALFLAPIAGVVADNFKRKNLLFITQITCLIHGIIITTLYFTGIITEWHILCLAILLGLANAFDMTARQSFVPLLISKENLTNAIALNSSMFNAARMLGPALAGFIIAAFNEGFCFAFNAFSYIPIIIFLLWVKPQKQIIKKSSSAYSHLKEGVLFAWNNKPLRALLMVVAVFSFWGVSFSTLLPIFSDKVLHSGAQGLGMLTGFSGIGAVCGGVFLASRKHVVGIKKIISVLTLVSSICLILFALSKSFALSCSLLFVSGFCFIIVFAGSNTLLQALSPDHLRGRIISLFSTMLMGMYPLGSLTIGFLAQHLGVSLAVVIGAMVCFSVGLYFRYRVPALTKDAHELLDIQRRAEGGVIPSRMSS